MNFSEAVSPDPPRKPLRPAVPMFIGAAVFLLIGLVIGLVPRGHEIPGIGDSCGSVLDSKDLSTVLQTSCQAVMSGPQLWTYLLLFAGALFLVAGVVALVFQKRS